MHVLAGFMSISEAPSDVLKLERASRSRGVSLEGRGASIEATFDLMLSSGRIKISLNDDAVEEYVNEPE